MYTEFIIIYVGLGVLALLAITILILLILLLKKNRGGVVSQSNFYPQSNPYLQNNPAASNAQTAMASAANIAFCKRCATEFDAYQHVCPRCGTPR